MSWDDSKEESIAIIMSFVGVLLIVWVLFSLFVMPYMLFRRIHETDKKVDAVMEMLEGSRLPTRGNTFQVDPTGLNVWSSDGIEVKVTAYSPTIDQCDDTPFITASNQRVRDGIVALSRDLEKEFKFKFGDLVTLDGIGVFEFQDRMHPRWERKVDVFMWKRQDALEFGVVDTKLILAGNS
jgi:3D (Asp-Asp-Asp) domain-containing protein